MTVPGVEQALALGLTREEYDLVCQELGGREPNEVELAMFSLLWSEHCAYKHSKKLLRTLPTEGPAVVMGPGENAGAVDVGGGYAIAFKVESHNHPSAVEPFQGAATGVYGNSIGVPTVGGEVVFEAPYETNCLVNAMALGLARTDDMIRSAAAGVGNVLVLFGASTGRDGIGGASVLASAELDESEDKRPSVQVGDPFEEKKLLECSLELLARGLLVALQDLGAAGLTSSASEMASKGEVGIDLDVAKVPLREADMAPFEIMVSESQERMLCVCEPSKLDEVLAVCAKWEVHGTAIGEVTDTQRFRVFRGDELVGDMPVTGLVDDCPLYDLEPAKPAAPVYDAPAPVLAPDASVHDTLLALLGSPNLASRRPLFEQYDCLVQSRTVRRPEEADAAVLVLPEGNAVATSIDGNGRRVAADPYWGTIGNALECAANLACVGAEPLGTTNNLNFGNPEKPHIAWQLTEAVRGLGDACRALGAPIVGGNVSLYNEGTAGPIYPTPVVGMVGLLPDPRRTAPSGFAREGDAIGFAGWNRMPSLAASELAKLRGEPLPDGLLEIDLDHCVKVLRAIREAVRRGDLSSCHDVAEGGWLVANAEACLLGGIGARLRGDAAFLTDEILFGEDACGFVVSGSREALERLGEEIPLDVFGTVGGDALELGPERWTLDELRAAHGALAPLFP
ncbi:MAG: phosphoribosylformylglycinamidine synthase subunit PurL [Solirubrobacterales bacterium]|nr:phosphoribosylformylglycinamidine synthase subunit PurL [Solirubrobacterales bacterium]